MGLSPEYEGKVQEDWQEVERHVGRILEKAEELVKWIEHNYDTLDMP